MIGGIVSGIGSAVGGVMNLIGQSSANRANIQMQRETNQANRELAEYNWQQQIDMWNRQNEYNAPTAQMSRLREAGLNPHLVYGNGVTGNNSSSLPTPQLAHMEAPRQEALRYGDPFKGIADGIATHIALKNMKADLEVKEANKDLLETQAAATSAHARKELSEMIKTMHDSKGSEYRNKFNANTLYPYQEKQFDLNLVRSHRENYKLDLEIDNLSLQQEVIRQNLWMSKTQQQVLFKSLDKLSADIAEAYSRVRLNNANTDKVLQEKANLEQILSPLVLATKLNVQLRMMKWIL